MKKPLLKFGIIQIIGLIFKLTLCTFTFSLQTFTIFFLINAFVNVYYNFLDVYHIYAAKNHRSVHFIDSSIWHIFQCASFSSLIYICICVVCKFPVGRNIPNIAVMIVIIVGESEDAQLGDIEATRSGVEAA